MGQIKATGVKASFASVLSFRVSETVCAALVIFGALCYNHCCTLCVRSLSPKEMQNIMEYVFSDRISALQPSAIREILKATADPAIIPFAAGNPDVAAFPVDDVRRISAKFLRTSL